MWQRGKEWQGSVARSAARDDEQQNEACCIYGGLHWSLVAKQAEAGMGALAVTELAFRVCTCGDGGGQGDHIEARGGQSYRGSDERQQEAEAHQRVGCPGARPVATGPGQRASCSTVWPAGPPAARPPGQQWGAPAGSGRCSPTQAAAAPRVRPEWRAGGPPQGGRTPAPVQGGRAGADEALGCGKAGAAQCNVTKERTAAKPPRAARLPAVVPAGSLMRVGGRSASLPPPTHLCKDDHGGRHVMVRILARQHDVHCTIRKVHHQQYGSHTLGGVVTAMSKARHAGSAAGAPIARGQRCMPKHASCRVARACKLPGPQGPLTNDAERVHIQGGGHIVVQEQLGAHVAATGEDKHGR